MIRVNLAPTNIRRPCAGSLHRHLDCGRGAELLQAVEIFESVDESYLWLEEAERRIQALDADPSRAIPGDDVMREARALLSGL